MTAAAGTTTRTDDAVAKTLLAALDPGTFGQPSAPEPAWTVRRSTLFEAERRLEELAAIFEHLEESGLVDDTRQLVEQVWERMAAEQETNNDKEEAA